MTTMRAPAWLVSQIHTLEQTQVLDGAIERAEPVARRLAAGAKGDALRGEWLGHALHPLLTDLPLGCWAASGLLDLLGGQPSRNASQRLVGLGLAFVPVTAATGWVDWSGVADRRVKRVGAVHAVGNTVVAVLYYSSWRARRRGHHWRGVALGLAGGLLAWGTGYLGGHMSFARGASIGARGLDERGTTDGSTGSVGRSENDAGLMDVSSAAALLGVGVEQVLTLVEADLLVPRRGSGSDAEFLRADVMAARIAGA